MMPWLIGTAFLHSVMVQEKRGMLRAWNVSLIVATFSLALLGTFLVRSGILQSIHAFGDSTVGGPILGLIAVVILGSTALIISRLSDLRSERRIDSLASREAIFLVNNLLLVLLAFIIFLGTFFPLIAEAFTGERATLAAPWFDQYTTPVAIALVLFTGIGPLLAWRRVTWSSARRVFAAPLVATAVVFVLLIAFTDARGEPWALALFTFAAFALTALAQEFWRGAAARRSLSGGSMPGALVGVTTRNRRRYGGYIVHVGIVAAADRRRRLLELSDQPRRDPAPRRERDRRRLRGHLPTAQRRRHQRAHRLRRDARGPQGRQGLRHPGCRPATTSAPRASPAARSPPTSRARRPARSASSPACAATSGPRCSPT